MSEEIHNEPKTTNTAEDLSTSISIDEKIKNLNDHLSHREKKLKELSVLLGDLNNDLNCVRLF